MHRKIILALLISAALPAALPAAHLWAGPQAGEAPAPAVQKEKTPANDLAFEPTRVTLDVKDTRVRAVLKEIERQTGNRISTSRKIKNVVLPVFKADGETYWSVLDRLGKASGHIYLWEEKGG